MFLTIIINPYPHFRRVLVLSSQDQSVFKKSIIIIISGTTLSSFNHDKLNDRHPQPVLVELPVPVLRLAHQGNLANDH